MSFSWVAEDIDGEESIVTINIAMNDTTNPANIIALDGGVRIVTLRTNNFSTSTPFMKILIEAQEGNIHRDSLPGLVFDADNKFYVQAVDISGAKSPFIALPDSGESWYVKKPSGNLLIVDDYATNDNAASFYASYN